MVDSILPFLDNLIFHHQVLVYIFAFIIASFEGIVILSFFPATTTILFLGTHVHSGALNIFILFPLIVAGAFVGDNIGYFLGRYFHSYLEKNNFIKHNYYLLAEKFIEKHGGKSIVLARFVAILRESAPFTAGIMGMSRWRFAFYNFLGAVGWATIILGGSYYVGEVKTIEGVLKILTIMGILTIFSLASLFYIKNKDLVNNK